MILRRSFPLLTAIWLQFAPMMARLEPVVATLSQPIALMLRWLAAGTAVSGAFHAVSGATGLTITAAAGTIPASGTIPATNGVSFSARFAIVTGDGIPKTYTYVNLPPGLTPVSTKPDTLQGKPTQAGNFVTKVIGWENKNASGHSASFSVKFAVKGAPPGITQQPTNQAVAAGGTAAFTVAATGVAPLTYQWTFEDVSVVSSSATASKLIVSNVTAASAGRYRVQVNSSSGSTWSDYATLTVLTAPAVISQQPVPATILVGEGVQLTVAVTGVGPFTYAWLKNGAILGGAAVGPTLSLPAVQLADAGDYQVRVSNAGGDTLSQVAKLTVNPIPVPVIATQPVAWKGNVGAAATFSVVVTGVGPLSYAWFKDGQELGGAATNATLTLASVLTTDAGEYRVRVRNPGGDTLSDGAVLTVNALPVILSQSGDVTLFPGEVAHLSVTLKSASGSPSPTVAWLKDGVEIAGAAGVMLTLGPVTEASAGVYRARIQGSGGTVLGDLIQVAVAPLPVITPLIDAGGLRVQFVAVPGREYVVETQSAAGEPWVSHQSLRPVAASAETVEPFVGQAQFFRVSVVPLP